MNRTVDELDRLLDIINDRRTPEEDAPIEGELRELLDLARGLKQLGSTEWPDDAFPARAAIQLSTRLGTATRFSMIPARRTTDGNGDDHPLPPLPVRDEDEPSRTLPAKTPWPRRTLEVAAAALVLVAFAALLSLLLGHPGGNAPSISAQRGQSGAAGAVATVPAATLVTTQAATPNATTLASASTGTPALMSNPVLLSLQSAAGFALMAPVDLPAGLTLAQLKPPMTLPGFTSVVLRYVDANGKETLTITEASPYQDSAQTMPADVWNNASPVDLGNDVTARLFQSNSDLQLWWQNGPTSIRLESGGAPGTTMLTREQVISVAASLRPVGTAEGQAGTPAVPAGATVSKAEQAVTIARGILASLGGNDQATVSRVSLAALSDETALGMPQPKGVRLSPLVWVIAFKDGLLPADCQQQTSSNSLCTHGDVVVVIDSASGAVAGVHGPDGSWR